MADVRKKVPDVTSITCGNIYLRYRCVAETQGFLRSLRWYSRQGFDLRHGQAEIRPTHPLVQWVPPALSVESWRPQLEAAYNAAVFNFWIFKSRLHDESWFAREEVSFMLWCDRLNSEASCDICYSTCMKYLRSHPRRLIRASQLASCTRGLTSTYPIHNHSVVDSV
jgi:hypothetical protein